MRKSYFRSIEPAFQSSTFVFYDPLPASAKDESWKAVVTLLREVASNELLETERIRSLRPNEDNYQNFVGQQWKSWSEKAGIVPPELAGLFNKDNADGEPSPRYDHCAQCTKSNAPKRCTRCKIVSYCSRECQVKHWKEVHRKSCLQAESRTLWKALHTNDGFLVTAQECNELARVLDEASNGPARPTKALEKYFSIYFRYAGELGGCFVL